MKNQLMIALLLALLFLPVTLVVLAAPSQPLQVMAGMTLTEQTSDCIPPEQRAQIAHMIAEYEQRNGIVSASPQTGPLPYPVYPQAGTLWQDLFIAAFVDLDPSSGIRDWNCTPFTYNGHTGNDSAIRSFREQVIGMPVFAALDGTVVDVHDGEPDMNTGSQNVPANYVIIDHGNMHYSFYWHLKQFSVAVSAGQAVTAGTQIGMTGSSGNSSGPHLHFESQFAGAPYEPYAGPCRTGASNWVNQIPLPQTTSVRDFCFSNTPFSGSSVFENNTRVGTFTTGSPISVCFRADLSSLPANSTYRIRFRRPDGTSAVDSSGTFSNNPFYLNAVWYWDFGMNLNVTGTWHMLLDINDQALVDAPFDVVSSPAQIVNRPPNPITIVLDPPSAAPGNATFCRVRTSLVTEDPDYAIIRYRYQWRINGVMVRDVTSAALSDAIRKDLVLQPSDLVTCTVTPSDESASGPAAVAINRTAFDFDRDVEADIGVWRSANGAWYTINSSNNSVTTTGWGINGDVIVPGDYDGDGKTDFAVWRPSNGGWYIIRSSNGATSFTGWGTNGDVPAPGDYDGDGKTDLAVFRPANGTWYILRSSDGATLVVSWGVNGDKPVAADYDGDGKADIAVFRPANGTWYIINSANGASVVGWGIASDKAVPADYDGDGKADVAVWRESNGTWYIRKSSDGALQVVGWGTSGDVPVAADYDGDGKTDVAVWRPSSGTWYIIYSSDGSQRTAGWGTNGDVPVPSAYVR